jgi:MFS family permease
VTILCVSNVVVGLASACFIPAATSLVPDVVSTEHLERGNAAHQFCGVGGRIVGQGIGGLIFTTMGAFGAMTMNALSFFTSAALESRIKVNKPASHKESESLGTTLRMTVALLRRTCKEPVMQRLLLFIAVFHLCLSVLPVSLPFYVEHVLDLPVSWFGFFVGSYTLGIMLGFILAGFLPKKRGRFMTIAAAGLGVGGMFGVVAIFDVAWAALPSLICIGIGIGVIIVNLMTELQLQAPQNQRAGIMGVAHAVGGSSLPIGMALTGIVIDILGSCGVTYGHAVQILLGISAVCTVTAGIAALTMNKRVSC